MSRKEPKRSLFRFLMALLPTEFRWRYGDAIENTYRDERRELASAGRRTRLRFLLRTLGGLLKTSFYEHRILWFQEFRRAGRRLLSTPSFALPARAAGRPAVTPASARGATSSPSPNWHWPSFYCAAAVLFCAATST